MKTPRTMLVVALALPVACAPADGETLDAFQMSAGDCFDDVALGSEEVADVPAVSCAQPHDNEVFATFDVPDGDFPGDERLYELADQGCLDRFQDAIGAPYEQSVLVFTTLIPSERSWNERNDREVVCVAYHMQLEKLTSSVLASGM